MPKATEHNVQLRSIAKFDRGVETHLIGRVTGRRNHRVEYVDSVELFERYRSHRSRLPSANTSSARGCYVAWRMDTLDYDGRHFLTRLHGGFAALEYHRDACGRVAA
jgi:hypothetical protein